MSRKAAKQARAFIRALVRLRSAGAGRLLALPHSRDSEPCSAALITLVGNYLFIRVGLNALLRLRTDLYACLQSLPLKYHDARRSSDSSFRVAYDSQSIQTIYNQGFATILSSVVMLIWTFGDHGVDELAVGIDFAGRASICRPGRSATLRTGFVGSPRPSRNAKATCSR